MATRGRLNYERASKRITIYQSRVLGIGILLFLFKPLDYLKNKYYNETVTKEKSVDKIFLGLIIAITTIGIVTFLSASLGVLAKNETKFWGILFNQLVLGLGGGLVAFYLCYRIDYKFWKKYSFHILILSVLCLVLVFIPKIGFSHAGAQRWVSIGPINFQPADFLKTGFIIYLASWFSWMKNKVNDFKTGLLPMIISLVIISGLLLKQPDTKSLIIILITALAMALVSGVSWKYLVGFLGVAVIGLGVLVFFRPYLIDRVHTFIDPSRDPTGSSFQLQQSLIAIGSGEILGRGLGQSIQKFSYLPEPQGDSIFAVIGEEFGFVGSVIIIMLFVALALRGLKIASRAPDNFSRLLVTGFIMLIITQSFLNIASIIGLFPLTGVPLVFISHGGTSLLVSLAEVGIILNISKYQKIIN